jgi:hypothetical protein
VNAFVAGQTTESALALCNYVDENRRLWTALLTGGAAAMLRAEFIRASAEVADRLGTVTVWPPLEIAVPIVVGSAVELLTWWLRQEKPLPVAEVAKIHENFIVLPALRAAKTIDKLTVRP